MKVILVIAVILIAGLLFLLDRALKAVREGRRRRDAGIRLAAAAAQAEEKARRQAEADEVSGALTAVLPAIRDTDRGPRRVA